MPLDPTSPYTTLQSKYEISPREVTKFCETFKGIGNENYTRLTGGEPTTLETSKFEEIIEILHSYNRRISMITNGYGLLQINDDTLKKIDWIVLDDHGINHKQIMKSKRHLENLKINRVKHMITTIHHELEAACEDQKKKGKKCPAFMYTPTLFKGTIHPCCSIPYLEQLQKTNESTRQLNKAGWHLDNPILVETMRNWRTTLPPETLDLCHNHCYRPKYKSHPHHTITLKPNDVISK